ncbi:hypothetical protein NEIELOOT_01879, partial [Neisseria elongata subsp. glycolytica ATCC 29315]
SFEYIAGNQIQMVFYMLWPKFTRLVSCLLITQFTKPRTLIFQGLGGQD